MVSSLLAGSVDQQQPLKTSSTSCCTARTAQHPQPPVPAARTDFGPPFAGQPLT